MKLTPLVAAEIVTTSISLCGCKPLPTTSSKTALYLQNVLKFVALNFTIYTLVPLLAHLYASRHDMGIFLKSGFFVCGGVYCLLKMIVSIVHRKRFLLVYNEMTWYLRTANNKTTTILQFYVDKCQKLYFITTVSPFSAILGVLIMQIIFEGRSLPVEAVYPFKVDRSPMFEVVYVQQLIWLVQAASIACYNNFATFLLWFAVSRLDLLSQQFQQFETAADFRKFSKTHQHILRFLDKTDGIVSHLLLVDLLVITTAIIFGSVFVFTPQPVLIKVQFFMYSIIFSTMIAMICWIGDNMIEISNALEYSLYLSDWLNMPRVLVKNILFAELKMQKPNVLSLKPIVSALSLEFFGCVMATLFKYLAAMKSLLLQN